MTNPYAPPTAPVEDIVGLDRESERAGRGVRLGASIIDGMVFGGLVYLPFLVGLIASTANRRSSEFAPVPFLLGGIGFVVWLWFTVKYVRANGQTIAKKLLGIKVVRADGSAVSLGRIFWLRNVVGLVFNLIPVLGVVYSLADALFIFSESRQCLHDRIADTIVVVA